MDHSNWLITGGCGFIGRSLIARLLESGIPAGRIRVFDNLSVGTPADMDTVAAIDETHIAWTDEEQAVALFRGDIRNRDEVARAISGADIVVHLAACTGVQPSVEDPHFDCETNVAGTLNCLDESGKANVRRFVFASSGAPLGEIEPPIHERTLPRPISPYGASKLAGEAYCSVYHACFGLDTVVLRFGNVYGPLSSKKSSVVARFINQALAGDTLEIFGDGSATRDYIFTRDLADAILRATETPGIGGEIFQIATNRETTVDELAECLLSTLESCDVRDVKLIHGAARKGDMQRNYSDTSKARDVLGWQAATSLANGLQVTVEWFVEQSRAAT